MFKLPFLLYAVTHANNYSGPSYGYFPEPRKSYLVVAPSITHLASDAFAGLGISVVCSHSGGVIGEATQCEDLIQGSQHQCPC